MSEIKTEDVKVKKNAVYTVECRWEHVHVSIDSDDNSGSGLVSLQGLPLFSMEVKKFEDFSRSLFNLINGYRI